MVSTISAASIPNPLDCRTTSTYNESSMEEFIIFTDGLKDLKNLSKQLHSAAEYFELSYMNDVQKQVVVDTLKDYVINAIVNTVDHLGSVTCKLTGLLDKETGEVSETELILSSSEQRLRTCLEYRDHEGISQQSMMVKSSSYHKRYIIPVSHSDKLVFKGYNAYHDDDDDGDAWSQSRDDGMTIKGRRDESLGKWGSGSVSRWLVPSKSRSSTPTKSRAAPVIKRDQLDLRKSASMHVRPSHPHHDHHDLKTKGGLIRSLLSRSKVKKDETLYTFLDEY